MEKYRVKRIEDSTFTGERLATWLNEQAQEGYVPVLYSSYLHGKSEETERFEVQTVIVEYRPAPDAKKKIIAS